jgi:hypothetical protein
MSPRTRSYLLALFAPVLWQAPAAAHGTVQMTKRDCQRLAVHVPAAGVAYQSGVDARGRPVAPADLGDVPRIVLPETILIDIDVDLQRRFRFPANADSYDADADIGKVEVAPDGTASFNGQPLQDEAQSALARRCQEVLKGTP